MIGRLYSSPGAVPSIRPCSCGKPRLKSFHLACPQCWAFVPEALQTKVYRLFKTSQGSDAHRAAVRECYKAIERGRELAAGAAATDAVEPSPSAPASSFKTGDHVQWMHEKSTGRHISLSQRTGVILEIHGTAAIVRDDVNRKKTKIATRRLRSTKEKGQVMEAFEAVIGAAWQSANPNTSPSPES